MNFKDSEFFLLVVAFLVGYFFQTIMKGCNVVEGLEEKVDDQGKNIEKRVSDLELTSNHLIKYFNEYKIGTTLEIYDDNFNKLRKCPGMELGGCGMETASHGWTGDAIG